MTNYFLCLTDDRGDITKYAKVADDDWRSIEDAGRQILGQQYQYLLPVNPADRDMVLPRTCERYGKNLTRLWLVTAPTETLPANINDVDLYHKRSLRFGTDARWAGHWPDREQFEAAARKGDLVPDDTVAFKIEHRDRPYTVSVRQLTNVAKAFAKGGEDGRETVTNVTIAALFNAAVWNPSRHERRLFPAGEGVRQEDGRIALFLEGMGCSSPASFSGIVRPMPADVIIALADGSANANELWLVID